MDITFRIPNSWLNTSDRQAAAILRILADNQDDNIKARVITFLRLTGIRLIDSSESRVLAYIPARHCDPADCAPNAVRCKKHRRAVVTYISREDLAHSANALAWIHEPPKAPWRPVRLAGAHTKAPNLSFLTFGQFLQCEGFFQGFLHTQHPKMLRELGKILVRTRLRSFRSWELNAIFMWYVSAKDHMAKLFPNFFNAPESENGLLSGPSAINLQKVFDAQIRALTKGDVLKEELVLSTPLMRALTELNALADEYQRMRDITK